jgi:hypothetical protein
VTIEIHHVFAAKTPVFAAFVGLAVYNVLVPVVILLALLANALHVTHSLFNGVWVKTVSSRAVAFLLLVTVSVRHLQMLFVTSLGEET